MTDRQQRDSGCAAELAAVPSTGANVVCSSGSQGVCPHAWAPRTGWAASTLFNCALLTLLLLLLALRGRCMVWMWGMAKSWAALRRTLG